MKNWRTTLSWQVISEPYKVRYDRHTRMYTVANPEDVILFGTYLGEVIATWIVEKYGWNYGVALDVVYAAKKEGYAEFVIPVSPTAESSLKLGWQVEPVLDAREAISGTPPPKGYNRYTGYVQYPGGDVEEIDVDAKDQIIAKKQVIEILKRDYVPGFLEPIVVNLRRGFYF